MKMSEENNYSKKFETHQHYYLKNGHEVVGVTTVLGQLNKPQLMMWSYKLGTQGVRFWEITNRSKNIGTLAHFMIQTKIEGITPDKNYINDFTKNEIDAAYRSYNLFLSWLRSNKISFEDSELQLVSEKYKYGGTIDIIAYLDNKRSLIDIKTGKNVYPETNYQLSAYRQLYDETHYNKIRKAVILHVPHEGKTASYNAYEIDLKQLDSLFAGFLCLLRFREINKKFLE